MLRTAPHLALLVLIAACNPKSDPDPMAVGSLEQLGPDGATPLLPQGAIRRRSMVVSAQLTAPADGPAQLCVQVAPAAVPIEAGRIFASYLQSGYGPVTIRVAGLGAGPYHWRAWAAAESGSTTDPEEYQGPGWDFTVDPLPANPEQRRLDGLTPIDAGGATDEVAAELRASVHSLDGHLTRALFEVKAGLEPFDGLNVIVGSWISDGGTSRAQAPLLTGAVHWRVRCEDAAGGLSGWIDGGTFERTASIDSVAPYAPVNLQQLRSDFVTPLAIGGTTTASFLGVRGSVSDGQADAVALEVELKPLSAAFDESSIVRSTFVSSGSVAMMPASFAELGGHHWRARTVDSHGNVSFWVSFGAYLETDADVIAGTPSSGAPKVPTYLEQFQLSGAVLPLGGQTTAPGAILKATVNGEAGEGLVLEVEVRRMSESLVGVPTGRSGIVPAGTHASIEVLGLEGGVTYQWQARSCNSQGAWSTWVRFQGVTPPPSPPSGGGGGSGGGSFSGGGCSASSEAGSAMGLLVAVLMLVIALRRGRA